MDLLHVRVWYIMMLFWEMLKRTHVLDDYACWIYWVVLDSNDGIAVSVGSYAFTLWWCLMAVKEVIPFKMI